MSMTMRSPERPRPLKTAADAVTKTIGMVSALLTAAAGYGIVTVVQDDAAQGLLGAIPGIITLVGNFLVAFGIVKRAEPQVTPTSSPQDNSGRRLVASTATEGI
jgi:hypothetical protein